MTFIRTSVFFVLCLCCCQSFAQHPLDKFVNGFTSTVIGNATDKLKTPVDLDFCHIPGREHELWVLNRESSTTGSMTIFFHAGTPTQVSQYRKDSHNEHFMPNPSAFAMADNGDFATTQEIQNSVGNTSSTFMGPALWMSDTTVFARLHQSNWDPFLPLGSHIDMLHQSPFAMGVAYEKERIYWVFDGYHKNLCRYDFAEPHEVGGDDHSDGVVWRYPEVALTRVPNLPAHMVLDPSSGWLYIVDNAKKRIIRVNTKTGEEGNDLDPIHEPLDRYIEMINVTQQVFIDTGLVKPCGIDYWNGRLVVTDNANGTIRIYDATGSTGKLITSLSTGASSIMGVKFGRDSNLWYVDASGNTVTRLTPAPELGVITPVSPPNNATGIEKGDTLKWLLGEGEFAYLVVLLEWGTSGPIIQGFSLEPTDHFVLGDLEVGSRYKWTVEGYSEDSILIARSEPWWFTAGVEPPGIPVLISPPDLSTGIPDTTTLVWAASQNATHYQLQLSKQSDFTTLELALDSTAALSQFIASLSSNTQYFWRVRAFNETTNSNWSPAWSFTTATSSVEDHDKRFALNIFPNPMQSSLSVQFTLSQPEDIVVELVNSLGITMHRVDHAASIGSNEFTIAREGLSAGSYLLRLHIGNKIFSRSVVILP